jgi:hypothetical protein
VAPETRVTRARRRAAVAVLVCAVTTGACYSTTPHRAEIASPAPSHDCLSAVANVFEDAGYVRRSPPPGLSFFYGPPFVSSRVSESGIGVTVPQDELEQGRCHVILEALSPDASCSPAAEASLTAGTGAWAVPPRLVSPPPPRACNLSYAPGAENDAAVDDLARRLRIALGATAQVDRISSVR